MSDDEVFQIEHLLADIAYATIEDEAAHDDTLSVVTFRGQMYMTTDAYEYLRGLVERFYPSGPIPCVPVACPDVEEVTICVTIGEFDPKPFPEIG